MAHRLFRPEFDPAAPYVADRRFVCATVAYVPGMPFDRTKVPDRKLRSLYDQRKIAFAPGYVPRTGRGWASTPRAPRQVPSLTLPVAMVAHEPPRDPRLPRPVDASLHPTDEQVAAAMAGAYARRKAEEGPTAPEGVSATPPWENAPAAVISAPGAVRLGGPEGEVSFTAGHAIPAEASVVEIDAEADHVVEPQAEEPPAKPSRYEIRRVRGANGIWRDGQRMEYPLTRAQARQRLAELQATE